MGISNHVKPINMALIGTIKKVGIFNPMATNKDASRKYLGEEGVRTDGLIAAASLNAPGEIELQNILSSLQDKKKK